MKYYVNMNKDDIAHLSNKKINNVNTYDNRITFETNEKSLQLLLKDIQELSYFNKRKVKIITFFKKYCISILSLLILLLFIINEQIVIKEIEFVNENTYSKEVENYIYDNVLDKKICYYYLNDNINNINKDLKFNFYYYEWINVIKKGNVLKVIIDNQDEKNYLDSTSNLKGDIISNRDGIIRYYFIKKGVNLIKDNQSIKKGDTLISGNLLINNNEVDYIHPIGIVLAEVVDTHNIKIKKRNVEYLRTGKIEIFENVQIFGLNNKECSFYMFDIEEEIIFDYKFIKRIKKIYYEIKEIICFYNKEDAIRMSYSMIEKDFNNNKVHEREKILESYLLEYYEDDEYYYFKYMVKKILNIAEFKCVNLEEK